MTYPVTRLRRLKRTEGIRRMVRETRVSADDLIYPLFVTGGENFRQPLDAIEGASLLAGAPLVEEAKAVRDLGIPAVLLFAVLEESEKDENAACGYDPGGAVPQAVRRIKHEVPDLVVITDLCLCEYTSHGHCGILVGGEIHNERTLECLCRMALAHARAGVDMVAPSGVMDGVVRALRSALDGEGLQNVATMPYSAKFASALYGPFKAATRSAPRESKHATHQVDVANRRAALHKIRQDIEEGADAVIVKPALTSLDIIAQARAEFPVPIAAYNVSGEHRMLGSLGAGDPAARMRLALEALTCIKRAGADMIITYFAKEVAASLTGRSIPELTGPGGA